MERRGFIHDMLDVKILILYVMDRVMYPVDAQKIYELCYQDDCLSYFDVVQAIPQMVASGHLLQQEDGSSYYGTGSEYAVSGYRYAGGYIGKAAMGSTAAIGGASVLDKVLSASNLLSALTVVASIIESSDVYGATGGFNVLATDGDGDTGRAGGYAGELLGVQRSMSTSRELSI